MRSRRYVTTGRFLFATGAVLKLFIAPTIANEGQVKLAALYPEDHRRVMRADDYERFRGAGVLFCHDSNNVPRKAAAAWLIGSSRLVMMNAHNFIDRHGESSHNVEGCFFQIGGRNYEFDAKSIRLGVPPGAKALHITDDWALIRLQTSVDTKVPPQPVPRTPMLPTGLSFVNITMVSPAGHANFRLAPSSIESCHIVEVDAPSEDRIRRVRHDCNDGFGGSGSGLFDEEGHLVAMHSASLDMDRWLPFDVDMHYGSALLIEGTLLDAIRDESND